jgi:hypothetical protein
LLRDAKRGHARRKKAGGGCCGKTIEAKPVFGQTQSIRGRRWTAQVEIIWNTAGNNGISQKDDGSTVLVTIALPLNGRVFGHRFSWRHRGPLTPYLRDAIVGNAEEDHPRDAARISLRQAGRSELPRADLCLAVEAAMACHPHESDAGD